MLLRAVCSGKFLACGRAGRTPRKVGQAQRPYVECGPQNGTEWERDRQPFWCRQARPRPPAVMHSSNLGRNMPQDDGCHGKADVSNHWEVEEDASFGNDENCRKPVRRLMPPSRSTNSSQDHHYVVTPASDASFPQSGSPRRPWTSHGPAPVDPSELHADGITAPMSPPTPRSFTPGRFVTRRDQPRLPYQSAPVDLPSARRAPECLKTLPRNRPEVEVEESEKPPTVQVEAEVKEGEKGGQQPPTVPVATSSGSVISPKCRTRHSRSVYLSKRSSCNNSSSAQSSAGTPDESDDEAWPELPASSLLPQTQNSCATQVLDATKCLADLHHEHTDTITRLDPALCRQRRSTTRSSVSMHPVVEYQVPFEMKRLLRGIPVRSDLRPRPLWAEERQRLEDAACSNMPLLQDTFAQTEVELAGPIRASEAAVSAGSFKFQVGQDATQAPRHDPMQGNCGEQWARRVVHERCIPAELNLNRWSAIQESTPGPTLEAQHMERDHRRFPGVHRACDMLPKRGRRRR
eukprot:TRINITY_DN22432_c0_g1_i1.p1 TRINITY_DN22432_c0_g1~~TRINITY_DN22432_c0_g1_i1.p1  ORF type:complete len:560 (-),score=55.28 TRINITY_DN22432_c0_g1_i1:138-1694(-)